MTTPVKLTPSLLAKALTQVYKSDLPDYYPDFSLPGPTWVQSNPLNITNDPAFQTLNPEITSQNSTNSVFPLITGDLSSDNQQVWKWIQSDAATASWLDGGTDPSNTVTADPDYVSLKLGQSPATDQFDEAYLGTVTCAQVVTNVDSCGAKAQLKLNSIDMLPVETNFDQAAAAVLAASDSGLTNRWDPTGKAPDGSSGWFSAVGTELPGQTFMWTVNDMPDLAAYGLVSASLCDPTGATCAQPSTDSVSAALGTATADSAGLLQVNPATAARPALTRWLTWFTRRCRPTSRPPSSATTRTSSPTPRGRGRPPGPPPATCRPATCRSRPTSRPRRRASSRSCRPSQPGTASPTASASTTASSSNTQQATTGGGSTTTGGGSTTTGGGSTTTGGGSTTTGGGSTTTGGGSTTTGGGSTTTGGGSTATGSTTPTTTATRSAATATCTPAAAGSPAATASSAASASASQTAAAATTPAGTACASSAPPAFDVLPGTAQAVAGTTQATSVTARNVIIIVLCAGGGGGILSGGLLFYGRLPRRGRVRERPGPT